MRNKFYHIFAVGMVLSSLCFVGCKGKKNSHVIKVQASSSPHQEILEFIKPHMAEQGVTLQIITVDDYNIPNRALAEKEIDANFFQHRPFLEEQSKQFGYKIQPLCDVHVEPMGIYAQSGSLQNLKKGGVITIPSDPTNEGRALALLAKAGLISLKEGVRYPTILDILDNPYGYVFTEVDAAFLARTWKEVTAAVIPTNYALLAGLYPDKDAIFIEDGSSLYVNILAVREGDTGNEDLALLKKHLESKETKDYIKSTYQGAIVPAH